MSVCSGSHPEGCIRSSCERWMLSGAPKEPRSASTFWNVLRGASLQERLPTKWAEQAPSARGAAHGQSHTDRQNSGWGWGQPDSAVLVRLQFGLGGNNKRILTAWPWFQLLVANNRGPRGVTLHDTSSSLTRPCIVVWPWISYRCPSPADVFVHMSPACSPCFRAAYYTRNSSLYFGT